MNCPSCPDTALLMTERQGVEIDYCPRCRGVWLDRGELDKLIERSMTAQPPASVGHNQPSATRSEHRHSSDDYRDYRRKHPAKSWLADIFD